MNKIKLAKLIMLNAFYKGGDFIQSSSSIHNHLESTLCPTTIYQSIHLSSYHSWAKQNHPLIMYPSNTHLCKLMCFGDSWNVFKTNLLFILLYVDVTLFDQLRGYEVESKEVDMVLSSCEGVSTTMCKKNVEKGTSSPRLLSVFVIKQGRFLYCLKHSKPHPHLLSRWLCVMNSPHGCLCTPP